jgi:glutamine synthetase
MSKYTREDIIRLVEEEDVEFIRLQFVDIFGVLKNVAVTSRQLEKVLDNKCLLDFAALDGVASPKDLDMYLFPDLDTFEIFPWRPQQGKVARMICSIRTKEGVPYAGDGRLVLQRVVDEAQKMGYILNVGPECEFFLFDCDESGRPTTKTDEQATFMDISPLDTGENARRDMILTLEEMNFDIESSFHEKAPGQHEIDFEYDDAIHTADNIMTFKMVVKIIARRHGKHATFLPKPNADVNGSGMHLNLSISDANGKNLFADEADEQGLSALAYQFIAGVMEHAKAITAITNPLVNSYKRLVPGFDAPVYLVWSANNPASLLHVPPAEAENKRIELRFPDATSNPYLALAVCLAAGLDGIKRGLTPPPETDRVLMGMPREEVEALGYEHIPENLGQAIEELEKDSFIKDVLGETIANQFIRRKKQEWRMYLKQVTNWEIDEYLYRY